MALASKWLERRRLAMAAPSLSPPLLDVGCGTCVAFEAASGSYVGIDSDSDCLLARSGASIQVVHGSALELPFPSQTFQTVLMMAVVEHLPDPLRGLTEATRVLKPGGRIVVTTPTPAGDRLHHLLAQVGITSKHAAEEHQSIFSGAALKRALEDVGLVIDTYQPFMLGGNQMCVGLLPPEPIQHGGYRLTGGS